MLHEPEHTSMDLRWTMFGVPIRVHPMFWLTSAFLGFGIAGENLMVLLVWVGCVFVSVLIHEMGHVMMGRLFGSNGHIVLLQFGGLAVGSANVPYRWQRILVSFAGPGIQLLLVPGLSLVQQRLNSGTNPLVACAVDFLYGINIFWPLFNLLPIWPLDGGQITRQVCEGVAGRKGTRASLVLSLLLAGFLAVEVLSRFLMHRPLLPILVDYSFGLLTALFFGLFAFNSYQELARLPPENRDRYDVDERDDRWGRRPRPRPRTDDLPWERPDERTRHGRDEGPRRREDDLPWER